MPRTAATCAKWLPALPLYAELANFGRWPLSPWPRHSLPQVGVFVALSPGCASLSVPATLPSMWPPRTQPARLLHFQPARILAIPSRLNRSPLRSPACSFV